jgi:hypothetical protein
MSVPLKKTFATKKISGWFEAIILWNSASSHLVIKTLIPFHSSLDNPTRRVHNKREFFFFNKQTISYKKDNLVPKFLNTRMDILRNFPTILSTWDSNIWFAPCEVRVAPTLWGDVNPISTSINNTPMPYTRACMWWQINSWERNIFIHIEITWCSSHTLNVTNNTKKEEKWCHMKCSIFIGTKKKLLEF